MATEAHPKNDDAAKTVLIIGDNACARRIDADLGAWGVPVVRASRGKPADGETGGRLLENASATACRGGIGDFTVAIRQNGDSSEQRAAAVVIAENGERRPAHDLFGLTLSPTVRPLSEIGTGGMPDLPAEGSAVFLHSLGWESGPAAAEAVMDAAMALARDRGLKTFILTGNLKVAGNGLEKRYRAARKAGVVFAKFTDTRPEIEQKDGKIRIAFTDEITRKPFTLSPDLVVVDERFVPSPALSDLRTAFGLHADPAGFLQADNVHRLTVETNRKGIFAAGPARGLQGQDALLADADAAATAVMAVLEGRVPGAEHRAEINRNRCVRCFTCYRLCPHGAVRAGATRVDVIPEACAGCGLCAVECPRSAIRFDPFSPAEIAQRIEAARKTSADAPFTLAFLCRRSAVPARDQALRDGWAAPEGLFFIEVPCAGAVSTEHLFAALRGGADGALVLSCHPDNCSSQEGTLHARRKVEEVRALLGAVGGSADRIAAAALAANMGAGFVRTVDAFQNRIAGLGGSQ